jgi:DNA-binding NarL/FixJ family response regulator
MTIAVFLAGDHAIVREGLAPILNTAADLRVVGQAEPRRLAQSSPFGDPAQAEAAQPLAQPGPRQPAESPLLGDSA